MVPPPLTKDLTQTLVANVSGDTPSSIEVQPHMEARGGGGAGSGGGGDGAGDDGDGGGGVGGAGGDGGAM